MLLEATDQTLIDQFPATVLEPQANEPCHSLTPYSLTLILAYIHYYTPERLPNGRFISPTHLRTLAHWIAQPMPQLRSIRQHRLLAAHIAILHAAGFLSVIGPKILVQPSTIPWLQASLPNMISRLQEAMASVTRWQEAVTTLGLQDTLSLDYVTYLQQSLARQCTATSSETSVATWLNPEAAEIWQLDLPCTLPLWLHFDLRQLGAWSPKQPLTCTPLTVALAVQHGYGHDIIQWLLETATGQSLSAEQQIQLNQWSRRAHVYRLRTVQLLSVPHPSYVENITRRKELRSAIIEHLSPRHLVLHTDIVPSLGKWLADQGYPLSQHSTQSDDTPTSTEAAYQWLALRILVGLRNFMPLSYPPPHTLLDSLSEQLPETEKTDLEAMAIRILEQLREAIHGRDAFFPAQEPPPPPLISRLQQAIAQETTLTIAYQALGDPKPTIRHIQPLRLEERGALIYLYAYCFRAEANLTFRLDRIHAWE